MSDTMDDARSHIAEQNHERGTCDESNCSYCDAENAAWLNDKRRSVEEQIASAATFGDRVATGYGAMVALLSLIEDQMAYLAEVNVDRFREDDLTCLKTIAQHLDRAHSVAISMGATPTNLLSGGNVKAWEGER